MGQMQIAPGKVVNGRVELDAELPEGTPVTVLALEGDETFEADAEADAFQRDTVARAREEITRARAALTQEREALDTGQTEIRRRVARFEARTEEMRARHAAAREKLERRRAAVEARSRAIAVRESALDKAADAIEATARYLGLGLAAVVNTFDPACVYIGGEITRAWDLIEDTVRSSMAERALTAAVAATEIRPVPATDYPRLRGAAALVLAPAYAVRGVA